MALNRRQGAEINNFTNFYKSLICSKVLRLPQFESEKMYLVLYVDDGLIIALSQDTLNKILSALNATFEMTKGDGNIYVDIEIERDRSNNVIFIHQKHYIDQLLIRFGMSNIKSCINSRRPSYKDTVSRC